MGSKIEAADAVKLFAGQGITVQTARRVTSTDKETGLVREGFETKSVSLKADHILGLRQDDAAGKVFITTIDGQKYAADFAAKA